MTTPLQFNNKTSVKNKTKSEIDINKMRTLTWPHHFNLTTKLVSWFGTSTRLHHLAHNSTSIPVSWIGTSARVALHHPSALPRLLETVETTYHLRSITSCHSTRAPTSRYITYTCTNCLIWERKETHVTDAAKRSSQQHHAKIASYFLERKNCMIWLSRRWRHQRRRWHRPRQVSSNQLQIADAHDYHCWMLVCQTSDSKVIYIHAIKKVVSYVYVMKKFLSTCMSCNFLNGSGTPDSVTAIASRHPEQTCYATAARRRQPRHYAATAPLARLAWPP
jgi:hypothetical protein